MKRVFLFCVACMCSVGAMMAQTTLSGDHIITGDLDVGTTGTPGNLEVTGETGNSASPGIKVTGDGGVVFEGNIGTGQIPALGVDGARFMWYSKKAATRIGRLDLNSEGAWIDSNIGVGSFALSHSLASGTDSVAISGYARGTRAVALGGSAIGDFSVGIAGGYSDGYASIALGSLSYAYGQNSIAAIEGTSNGIRSVAMVAGMTDGLESFAIISGYALAEESFAAGPGTIAAAHNSFVIGRNNTISGSESDWAWVASDPLFVIGNGTGVPSDPVNVRNRDALVVYKSGDIKMPKRQGDILMGEFGNPE